MPKGTPHRKQHYIPQHYLREFGFGNDAICVFDKTLNDSFVMSIKKACQIDDFYKVHRKFADEKERDNFDENYYETGFFAAEIETGYHDVLKEVRKKVDDWKTEPHEEVALDKKTRDLLAGYFGIQLLRLPHIRNNYYQAYKKGQQKQLEIIAGMLATSDPELKEAAENIKAEHDDDYASVVHARLYANPKLINGIQNRLILKKWAFFVSQNKDLYTSDSPLVVVPHISGQYPYDEGTGMRGAQIIVPVFGDLVISMWDDDLFESDRYQAESFQELDEKNKIFFNQAQFFNAEKQLFCAMDRFETARMLQTSGERPVRVYKSKIEVY